MVGSDDWGGWLGGKWCWEVGREGAIGKLMVSGLFRIGKELIDG